MKISPRQQRILEEVANTFISPTAPQTHHHHFWQAKGSERVSAEKIGEVIASQPRPAREEFAKLLLLLDSPLLGLTWAGVFKKFLDLTPNQREKLFIAWSASPSKKLRKAFSSLKKLCTFIYFSSSDLASSSPAHPRSAHPDFEAIQYSGPLLGKADSTLPLNVIVPEKDTVLSCDVLVIGSGAGGGVVAGELAEVGKDVIVVEKGPYLHGEAFSQEEGKMVETLFDGKGAITSSNGQISIFAGSCLGGGTTVNWAGSFHTPDYILDEWATDHSIPFLKGNSFQTSQKAVAAAITVNTEFPKHNVQNQLLHDGSRRLGQEVHTIARNEKYQSDADFHKLGFSSLGDRYGIKQGTAQTYLRKAASFGARIICKYHVDKISVRNGQAMGVEGTITTGTGETRNIYIKADKVVVAAGSIQTPALLRRSGIAHPEIGRNLFLHPTVGVSAIYPQKSEPWLGPMMSVVNDHFARTTGNHGFKLETPPTHPGLMAMSMPWNGSLKFKEDMVNIAHIATFIAIVRDKHAGYVTTDKEGKPVVNYQLHKFDLRHVLKGLEEASRIHFMNDCREVVYPHFSGKRFSNTGRRADLEKFLHEIPVWGWKPNQFALYSAHQMGTCRMGGDKAKYPTNPEGALYNIPNIFIADASVFPAASGVNPMLTIMALAHHTAQGLK